jgi:CheY-like chemotaxis protein
MSQPRPTILLVEDNDDDVFIMKHALKGSGIDYPLQIVTDGQQALDYLSGKDKFADRERYPLPCIAFLDLKLPYVSGFEILAWIRQRPDLNSLLVVVLTGSSENKDCEKAYALGARSYLVKPPTTQGLKDIFNSLQSFQFKPDAPAKRSVR